MRSIAPVLLQRQNILTSYPQYTAYSKQVKKLRGELAGQPLVADSPKATRVQADKLAEIARISGLQETLLREIALRREAAELVFPPLRHTRDVQAAMPPRSALLVFFKTSSNTYAFLMSKRQYMHWKLESPPLLEKDLSALLKKIGNFDANHEILESQLSDDGWRQAARDLTDALMAGSNSKVNLGDGIDELVVVPDGAALVSAVRGAAGSRESEEQQGPQGHGVADQPDSRSLSADDGPGDSRFARSAGGGRDRRRAGQNVSARRTADGPSRVRSIEEDRAARRGD